MTTADVTCTIALLACLLLSSSSSLLLLWVVHMQLLTVTEMSGQVDAVVELKPADEDIAGAVSAHTPNNHQQWIDRETIRYENKRKLHMHVCSPTAKWTTYTKSVSHTYIYYIRTCTVPVLSSAMAHIIVKLSFIHITRRRIRVHTMTDTLIMKKTSLVQITGAVVGEFAYPGFFSQIEIPLIHITIAISMSYVLTCS